MYEAIITDSTQLTGEARVPQDRVDADSRQLSAYLHVIKAQGNRNEWPRPIWGLRRGR